MKRFGPLLFLLVVTLAPSCATADMIFGAHATGLQKSFFTATSNGSNIRDTAGLAFDPTHWDINGNYDRVFLANHEDSTAKSRRGIHVVDIFNATEAVRVARTGTNNPFGVIADSSGDIRVNYGYDNGANNTNSPSVRKVINPVSGVEVDSRMINSYGSNTLNDPISIAFVPNGFGGGYEPGEDVILFDQAYDSFNRESVVVLDKLSTHTSPLSSVVYSDGSRGTDSNFRGDASNVDGYAYFARMNISTGDLSGTTRPYIERVKGDGILQRMFLDIDASLMSQTLDNALKINPVDGSVWLPINDGGDRKFYRVDVANAAAQGGNDFLADISQEITLTGSDSYAIGVNSMAFSPDGKQLAVGIPANRDSMRIYDLTVDSDFVLSVNNTTGELILRNDTSQSIDFASYSITSPMDALNISEWNSLSDQSGVHPLVNPVDGQDPDQIAGNSTGESWTESIGSSASTLGELFLYGETTLAPGEMISLGKAYNTSIEENNLSIEFLRANPDSIIQGVVEYVSTLTGDYNGDNIVDSADFTVWRDYLGQNIALPNESETVTPGVVTIEDYEVWRSNFGLSTLTNPASASSVPEPTTLGALLLGLLGMCSSSLVRQTRRVQ